MESVIVIEVFKIYIEFKDSFNIYITFAFGKDIPLQTHKRFKLRTTIKMISQIKSQIIDRIEKIIGKSIEICKFFNITNKNRSSCFEDFYVTPHLNLHISLKDLDCDTENETTNDSKEQKGAYKAKKRRKTFIFRKTDINKNYFHSSVLKSNLKEISEEDEENN